MKKLLLLLIVMAIMVVDASAQISVSFTNVVSSCNNDGSIEAVVTGGQAPYTYEWYHYPDYQTQVGNTAILNNVAGGYYLVTVTDNNGLQSQQVWASIPSVLSMYATNYIQPTCPLNNGSLSFVVNGGTGPYDYYWNNGTSFLGITSNTTTATGLSAGNYQVSVTDANGCTLNETDSIVTLTAIAPFTVAVNSTPANCNDGTATANVTGGTAPFTYLWATTPPQATATATGLNGNTYPMVTVTDADGCVNTAYANISFGPSALQVYSSSASAVCPNNNGSINLSVSSGTPPYSYIWSNGATTQDLNLLSPGTYSCTVSDAAGCYIDVVKYVGQSSPVYATVSVTSTGCSNNTGTAVVSASGGQAPYTYAWNNGATTASISGLSYGYYGVTVTDANGCTNNWSAYGYVSIPSSCFAAINGFVYNDEDGNCNLNGNEMGFPWQLIDLGNGYYSSTNQQGWFNASYLIPATYTVSHNAPNGWNTVCPVAAYTVSPTIGQTISGNDFYDQPQTLQQDVQLFVYGGLARPGFTHNKYYTIYNSGTVAVSGTVEITHDVNEVFLGAQNAIAYNPGTRTITLSYNSIPAFGYEWGDLQFSLPANVAIGTLLNTTGIANPLAGDADPVNNYDTSIVAVVGSYDPNMKEVSPKGAGAAGLISANNADMEYTIHFQNTGNYMAETVAIIDTLDADLDISTFHLTGASHNVTWEISGPRIVKFTFQYIYLPDSLSDEPGSHGFVKYSIKQLPNLAGGTEIKNTAYIYFDYNAPIVTNTTLNTIEIVGIKENKFNTGVVLSPNPATELVQLINKNKENCSNVEIVDISGRTVMTLKPVNNTISLSGLASGVYIVNASYPSGVYKEKLIISK